MLFLYIYFFIYIHAHTLLLTYLSPPQKTQPLRKAHCQLHSHPAPLNHDPRITAVLLRSSSSRVTKMGKRNKIDAGSASMRASLHIAAHGRGSPSQ